MNTIHCVVLIDLREYLGLKKIPLRQVCTYMFFLKIDLFLQEWEAILQQNSSLEETERISS